MKSALLDIMPSKVRRSLKKLGADLKLARRKRRLTTQMMAERMGVGKSTYLRLEKGDPTVSMGTYAMALFVLGFGDILGDIVDSRHDDQGLLLEEHNLPQRVRPKREPTPL